MSRINWLLMLSVSVLSLALMSQQAHCNDSTEQINNDSCMKCHKRNGKMQGHHALDELNLSCSSCHGEKGNHPKKPNDLMVFSADSDFAVATQNQVCLTCHIPKKLADTEWTHNVHAQKVACSACHQLHPQTDRIMTLTTKQRSDECQRCHSVQR
ncbi:MULTISPECIES: multiheme c-type cytochrome [Shewanella]|uniref:Multiheme c-type cytochrome n=1 Tax=Shewanella metallivivens TaxID=2872342 RepID=A0ABT5TSH4_9GAMM|nr:multiheme c-type cytochrome [Shewanella metallivivens]MDD8061218.1 multiheme c-type cytochrome [Shewanella metallivivens]